MLEYVRNLFKKQLPPLSVSDIARSKLTYLPAAKLQNIAQCIQKIQTQRVPGDFVEFGVALGGSGIFIARQMARSRRFVGLDVFGMIPAPGPRDDQKSHERYRVIASGESEGIGGDRYYGYEPDLLTKVKSSFAAYGIPVDGKRVTLLPGRFEDTLPHWNLRKIAFAHINCDWFDPITLCLETTLPLMSPGGFIILDDYKDYGGCKRATDEFLQRHKNVTLLDSAHNAVLRVF
ncbi:methyltransferase [Candidatus Paraburkholderia schumanniana]|nr:methyltransferase [Candidatus Paraburkholderia schumannianae]